MNVSGSHFGGFYTWGARGIKTPSGARYFIVVNVAMGCLPAACVEQAFGAGVGYGIAEACVAGIFFGIALYASLALWERRGK